MRRFAIHAVTAIALSSLNVLVPGPNASATVHEIVGPVVSRSWRTAPAGTLRRQQCGQLRKAALRHRSHREHHAVPRWRADHLRLRPTDLGDRLRQRMSAPHRGQHNPGVPQHEVVDGPLNVGEHRRRPSRRSGDLVQTTHRAAFAVRRQRTQRDHIASKPGEVRRLQPLPDGRADRVGDTRRQLGLGSRPSPRESDLGQGQCKAADTRVEGMTILIRFSQASVTAGASDNGWSRCSKQPRSTPATECSTWRAGPASCPEPRPTWSARKGA